MAKRFKVKTKLNAFDKFMIGLFKLFKGKHRIINLNEDDIPIKSIWIGNHCNSGGPINYSMYFSDRAMFWAAHQMCGKWNERWNYAYHTFYRQKLYYGKFKSWILATLLAFIAPLAYGVPGVIPVYYDLRVIDTFKKSLMALEGGQTVFVFPEESEEGYLQEIRKLNSGFIELSKIYYKKYGVDLPIYTLHLNKKPKKIVIGKPFYYRELAKQYSDEEICVYFTDYMNSLKTLQIIPEQASA